MSQDTDIVIVSAARTPVGSFGGTLASLPAHELGTIAIKAALQRANVQPGDVSEVILGQVLTAAQGQGPARRAAIGSGRPRGCASVGHQPDLRLGTACRSIGRAADPDRRFDCRRRRRSGEHEPIGARDPHARRYEDGRR